MRKGIIIRALIAMSLVSVFLAGGRDAAFAHAQLAGAPRTPLTGTSAALPNGYEAIYRFQNMITSWCIADVSGA